jgi:hypothetical protein
MESTPNRGQRAEEELADRPVPLSPARGHGLVAERLISINGLISLAMLAWSVAVLRRPALLHNLIAGFWRRFPWIVGSSPPR